jgi:hypothetical protein
MTCAIQSRSSCTKSLHLERQQQNPSSCAAAEPDFKAHALLSCVLLLCSGLHPWPARAASRQGHSAQGQPRGGCHEVWSPQAHGPRQELPKPVSPSLHAANRHMYMHCAVTATYTRTVSRPTLLHSNKPASGCHCIVLTSVPSCVRLSLCVCSVPA